MSSSPSSSPPSPITADFIVSGAVGISEVVTDGNEVYWVESRPDEGGRIAAMKWSDGVVAEITGPDVNVRTRVHEYGGGAWWVDGGRLFFSDDARDGELFVLEADSETQLTFSNYRYADGTLTPDGAWFIAVRERHDGPADDPVANELVAISTDGEGTERVLVDSFDFVSSPALGPDGQIVCVAWNHPNMPWDFTNLVVVAPTWVDGDEPSWSVVPSDQPESIVLPGFTSDGRLLAVTDRSNWWNLVEVDQISGAQKSISGGEFEIATAGWVFGLSRWCETPDGVVVVEGTADGDVIRFANGATESRHTAVNSIRTMDDGRIAYVGASYSEESAVWVHDGTTATPISNPRDLGLDPALLAAPEVISFDSSKVDNSLPVATLAHALFYEPALIAGETVPGLAPLLVLVHGGPTAAARRQLDLTIRYWTSRGIAVAAVDYRGSTLYGREFRNQLHGAWGIADVVDCVAAAQALAEQGRVDANKMFISGGSAGGLTVLNAVAKYNVFTGGICRYGVTDLRALATDTHKFESRYLDRLVGEWPADEQAYIDRSPMSYPEEISVPMLILQGSEDKVVPPSQAEMIVDALQANEIPVTYELYQGEGHGFRSAETIVAVLEATESFIMEN